MLGSIISGGLGLAGSLFGNKSRGAGLNQAIAAAQFRPWDVQGPLFGATFDEENKTINTTMSEPMEGLMNQLMGNISGGFDTDIQRYYDLLENLSGAGERRKLLGLESRLFNQGRLGSTGGALQMKAGLDAVNDAMIKRELAAYDLQNQMFNQSLGGLSQLFNFNQGALAPAGMGSGIGLNMAQVGASLMPAYTNYGEKKGGMFESLFGGLGSAIGGLF